MQKLAEICIKRPVFATMLIMALTVMGAAAYLTLGVDFFPKIDLPFVTVTTTLRGASPEEVESQVTKRIEEAVNQISGIDTLRSISNEGISIVTVGFVLEKDGDIGAQEVRDKINTILADLPEDADPPVVDKLATDASPILNLAVSSDRDLREITKIADDVIKKNIESTQGVGQVRFIGDRQRQIQVWIDGEKLYGFGLNIDQVRAALGAQNVEIPGGRVNQGPREVALRTLGRVEDPRLFENIIVANVRGTPVRVRDIARVEDGAEEARSLAKVDGQPSVVIEIRKQAGTNTLDVIRTVKDKIESLRPLMPPDFRIRYFSDQSEFIQGSFEAVQAHLIEGGLFAAIIVFFFLTNLRSTVIAAVAIPTSIVATFAAMKAMNFTLDQITMLALVLMVGIVIDDAIVVLENIYRNMEEKGLDPFRAAIAGTREIGLAVLATTLSLVVIFLPVALMPGIVGRFMSSLGYTAAFAIMVSLLVSFTLTPMLSSRFLRHTPKVDGRRPRDGNALNTAYNRFLDALDHMYGRIEGVYVGMLRWSMSHRIIVSIVAVLTILSTGVLGQFMGTTFLPRDDRNQFEVGVRMPPGSSLDSTEAELKRIEGKLREVPHVRSILTTIGADQQRQVDRGVLFVQLSESSERQENQFELMEVARDKLRGFRDMTIAVREVSAISGFGPQADLQYVLQGPDLDQLNKYAQAAKKRMQELGGVTDIDLSYEGGKPEYRVVVNRDVAADLGVNVTSIASALRTFVAGDEQVTTYREGEDRYDVMLRVSPEFRNSPGALSRLFVPSTRLGNVPVDQVARFEEGTGPVQIERGSRQRQILISANFEKGQTLGKVIPAVQETLNSMNMPPGYVHRPEGQSKEFGKAIGSFFAAFLLAIVFMYMVLAAQFESFVDPITILLSLPLSIPFAILSLVLTREPFSIVYTSIGVLVLFGIVKKNSILQIDHIKQLRASGEDRLTAIIHGCRDRLRPILMTTAALVAGMIPLVLGGGPGSASRRTVGIVVIGGQTLCLLLTLLVTPVSYSLFDDLAKFSSKFFARFSNRRAAHAQMRPLPEPAVGD